MRELMSAVPSGRAGRLARRFAALALLATALSGCAMVEFVMDGLKQCSAVASDLAGTVGVKPNVGFKWTNGRLENVSVAFPKMIQDKPLGEVAELTRAAVAKEFKQRADNIELTFSLGPTEAAVAQAAPSSSTN